MRQAGLFGLSDHLQRLSAFRDPLEELARIVDFEVFQPALVEPLAYGDGAKGGRAPDDPVAMLKVLILAAQNNVSDARMEYLIRDRPSWMRFLGLDLGAATPDTNTIRLFREKLTEAGALERLKASLLVGQAFHVLEQMKPNHQTGAQTRTALLFLVLELAKLGIEPDPVDTLGQLHQRMTGIDHNLHQHAVQFVLRRGQASSAASAKSSDAVESHPKIGC